MRIPVTGTAGAGGFKDENAHRQTGTVPWERWYFGNNHGVDPVVWTNPAIDNIFARPFISPRSGSIDRIQWYQGAGAGAGNTRVAIYAATSDTNLYPGALILDTGDQSTAADGYKTVVVAQALTGSQLYYVAYNSSRAVTLYSDYTQDYPILGFDPNPSGTFQYWNRELTVARAYGAWPANFPAGAAAVTTNITPAITMRWSA